MLRPMWEKGEISIDCTEAYREHIMYAHYVQCRLLRNPSHTYIFFEYHKQDRFRDSVMI